MNPREASVRLWADGLAPAMLGGLATLGFAPWNIYPVTLAAMAAMLVLWRGVGPARGAWRGFVFGCAFFGSGIYWVYGALQAHAGLWGPLAGLAVAVLVVYLACYPALAGAIATSTRRFASPVWALLIVPAAWGLSELLRGWLGTGFPWLSLGYVTISAPLNGLGPLLGVYGLSIAFAMAAGTLWLLYAGGLVARLIALALVAVWPVLMWWVPPAAHWTHPVGPRLRVMIIQGNNDRAEQGRPAMGAGTPLARYRDMTERSHAELVVWPEIAVPLSPDRVRSDLARLDQDARRRGQTVLVGLLWRAPGGTDDYHSVLALGQGGGRYDPRHRLPFDEYGPVWLLGRLAGLGMPVGRTAPGAGRPPLIHGHGVVLGVSVGFEDLSARNIARDLPAAGFLVNVTDEARLAGTPALAQHLEIARMRALEAGRPMVRAANTGISALIGFDGRIYQQTPVDEIARLVAPIAPRRGLTPYMRYGDAPLWWATTAIVLLALVGARGLGWHAARRRRPVEYRRALRERR